MKVLVTGASGFVGRALTARLVALGGCEVMAATRAKPDSPVAGAQYLLTSQVPWQTALAGIDVMVHAAARVHVLNDDPVKSVAEFERVNVDLTLQLAQQAAMAGVRRFLFLSSIGVNGVKTTVGTAFSENDQPQPYNPYADSKLKAELGLRQIAEETGLEVVVIRPPLVYGPGVRANFAALMHAVQRGWPLPLGAVHNLRSMVAINNLVDFIATCLTHPRAGNQIFLVSDGHDVSSPELVRNLARAMGVSARLVSVPVPVLWIAGRMFGHSDVIQRVCGSLRVDISKARRLLDWTPSVSMEEGLRGAVAGMRKP